MIQRIQTLYLLLAAAALALALQLPWGTFFAPDGSAYVYKAFAVEQQVGEGALSISFWALGVVLCLAGLLSLATVFFFKKRLLQARFCIFGELILIGYYLVYVLFMFLTKSRLEARFGLGYGTALPFVAMVLIYLALRAILKDEQKARAYERIR